MATTSIDVGPADGHAENPRAAIRVRELWKRYGSIQAVRGIDLEVERGEIFGLIGPDGAGKTSTFQILAGVMEATGGTAEVFGRPARETRSQTGYLTQAFSLYPDLSVMENIRYIGDLAAGSHRRDRGARTPVPSDVRHGPLPETPRGTSERRDEAEVVAGLCAGAPTARLVAGRTDHGS